MPTVPDDLLRTPPHRRPGARLALVGPLVGRRTRQELTARLQALDLEQLARLYAERDHVYTPPSMDAIRPVPVVPVDSPDNPRYRRLGEEALRRGEVAVLVVAGGQGTRLGFDQPKGMFPIGPVTQQEPVPDPRREGAGPAPALRRRRAVARDDQPGDADARRRRSSPKTSYFGLPKEEVHFFRQGTMPALDLATGKLLMEAPGRLFLSPDGHGGTLTALASSGLLARLHEKGIRHIFYFQVDNPLVKVADPTFLGCHIDQRSEASSRVIPKLGPTDKLGNFVQTRRPLFHDRVFRSAVGNGPADGRQRPAASVGGQPGHPLFRRGFPDAHDDGRRPDSVPRRPQEGALPGRTGPTR